MPARPTFSLRPLTLALLATSLAGAGTSALAVEQVAPVRATAAASSARETAAETEPKAKGEKGEKVERTEAPKRAALPKPVDPLEHVRERLAEKLGATKLAEAPEPNVVRVVTRATAPAASARLPRAKAAASRGDPASPMAERLATEHRSGAESVHAQWDYAGSGGPDTWGQMKPEFARCSSGLWQSPIDIRDGIKVNLDPVQFDYKPSAFRVLDNGHTVQVNVGPGNSIDVGGRRYDLVQFHFHRPSEERINGRQFDMVVHLVHKDIDNRLAVVAVLLDRGSAHPLVQNVWNNLPLEKGDEVAARTTIDLNALLPTDRSYFTYMGSLTTPPCSEGVLWMVMKAPMPISSEQIGIFARLYPMNARPIQSVSGRLIKESN
ncbi:MAG: carbonic anhydrase family protein [Bacteriovorax sp.]|nr:carbonic anhydrase family protein [Rhizobacter sp.]